MVLKLEEVDYKLNKPDTTIYIIFDSLLNKYVIRGKRRDVDFHESASATYSFDCYNRESLINFLMYVICKNNTVNETLYVYDNMPKTCEEITFEFLQRHDNKDYEISGYDNQKISRKNISKLLDILQNVNNLYN
jgi:hypothetical protein